MSDVCLQGRFCAVGVGVDIYTGRNVLIKTLPKFQISQPDEMQSAIRILFGKGTYRVRIRVLLD